MSKIISFAQQCKRVWSLLKKPSKKEFTTIAKVSAVGLIIVLGLLGFLVNLIMTLLGVK